MTRFLSILVLLALIAAPALADDAADVRAVEKYLNSLTTLKARFSQMDATGKVLTGDFMLKRPGRMRFQYDPPMTDFIVADGFFVYYYDGEMKQQSNTLISRSLADFFLRKDIRLSGDIKVARLARDEFGMLRMTLTQSENPAEGSLTLFFFENPLSLQKWQVIDAQGATTDISLSDVKTEIKLKGGLFHYYDPEHGKPLNN